MDQLLAVDLRSLVYIDGRCAMRSLIRDKSGAVLIIAAVVFPVMFGFSALMVDAANLYYAQRSLQTATNAAALAGAQVIGTGGNVTTAATNYSAVGSPSFTNHNSNPNFTVISSQLTITPLCFSGTGIACSTNQTPSNSPTGMNGVEVKQAATVSTYFGWVIGLSSVNLSTTAYASAKGGKVGFFNVAFILDTTRSMGDAPTGPAESGACNSYSTAIACAQAGIETMLGELWPCLQGQTCPNTPVTEAAFFVFPGVKTAPSNGACGSLTTVAYDASPAPIYEIISFVADYRTSDTATTVYDGVAGGNSSSNLVKCAYSEGAPGGQGTFYGDAITAAQTALVAEQSARKPANSTNVIILLTDGNASSGATTNKTKLCSDAVTAAQAAAAAGTWVFAIYYDDNGTSSTCTGTGDAGNYTGAAPNGACYTLQQIANSPGATSGTYVNDPTKFYSTDGTSSPCPSVNPSTSIGGIGGIFASITSSLSNARLLSVYAGATGTQ